MSWWRRTISPGWIAVAILVALGLLRLVIGGFTFDTPHMFWAGVLVLMVVFVLWVMRFGITVTHDGSAKAWRRSGLVYVLVGVALLLTWALT